MIRALIRSFLLLFPLSGLQAATYFAAPSGVPGASGSTRAAPAVVAEALAKLKAGDTLRLAPGVYPIPYDSAAKNTIALAAKGSATAPIVVMAESDGRAVFDFSYPPLAWTQDGFGFHLTGDYWHIRGISVTRAGYQGVYVTGSHNTLANCAFFGNRNSGIEINKGGAYTTLIDCDAYRNYDPKKSGSMADGFAPKQTQGPGNRLIRCRAWENSDDGFDAFDSPDSVIFEQCWAFRNGVDVWNYGGFAGNGNGFKLGGNSRVARHRIVGSIAFDHPGKGFDQNNNSGGITLLNNLGYRNGRNFGLTNPVDAGEEHVLRNNISLGGSAEIGHASEANNSWNPGFSVSAADFRSLDTALATQARTADGSLPESPLFRLKAGSALIDAGIPAGLPFRGLAPDLGPFESEAATTALAGCIGDCANRGHEASRFPKPAGKGLPLHGTIRIGFSRWMVHPVDPSRAYSALGESGNRTDPR